MSASLKSNGLGVTTENRRVLVSKPRRFWLIHFSLTDSLIWSPLVGGST